MKILILIFTMLFSAAILADCCNFDSGMENQTELAQDNCEDSSSSHSHNDLNHCGCSHLGHLKFFNTFESDIASPHSFPLELNTLLHLLRISDFPNRIFYPPKSIA